MRTVGFGYTGGFKVAHTLKTGSGTSCIPIIAMTGHYTEEERKHAINICGIKRCLTKPVDMMEYLFREIEKILGEG